MLLCHGGGGHVQLKISISERKFKKPTEIKKVLLVVLVKERIVMAVTERKWLKFENCSSSFQTPST